LGVTVFCQCQPARPVAACDCSSKQVRDSLIKRYIDHGAVGHSYNGPVWQLYCDSLIAICPSIAIAYQHKAIPYIKDGEYEKAFRLEDKAVQYDTFGYLPYRGFLKCIFTKDYEGALRDFKRAAELTPNGVEMDHTYFFYKGLCHLELGDFSAAKADFKQDIFLQRGNDTAGLVHYNTLLYLGILYYCMKEYDSAETCLLKCLAQYDQLPEANYYLALVYKALGDNKLKGDYLLRAKMAISQGYGINEDNVYYANYPRQIKLYEIDRELSSSSPQ
jgi:tetratricopeptide (TPR) repeat protein